MKKTLRMTKLPLMFETICCRDIVPFVLLRNGVRGKKEGKERRENKIGKEDMGEI